MTIGGLRGTMSFLPEIVVIMDDGSRLTPLSFIQTQGKSQSNWKDRLLAFEVLLFSLSSSMQAVG